MERDEIREMVTTILVTQLGVKKEDVKDDSIITMNSAPMNDTVTLGADSLDQVELVMAIEEDFKIDIPDEEAEKFIKVSDVIDYLEKQEIK